MMTERRYNSVRAVAAGSGSCCNLRYIKPPVRLNGGFQTVDKVG